MREIIGTILVSHVFLYLSLAKTPSISSIIPKLSEFNQFLFDYIYNYFLSLFSNLIGWYIPLIFIGFFCYQLAQIKPEKNKPLVYWLISSITIFSLFTINHYSSHIYPNVRASLGGGSLSTVTLVVKTNNKFVQEYMKSLGLLENNTDINTKDIKLIVETSNYYYLTNQEEDKKIIQLNKSDVASITFVRNNSDNVSQSLCKNQKMP